MHPMLAPLRLAALALLAAVSLSCAASTVQVAPFPDTASAPAADRSRVYVARATQFTGRVRRIEIVVSDEVVGELGEAGFLCFDLPAGRSMVQAFFKGSVIDGKPVEAVFNFEGQGGETYYFELQLDRASKKAQARALDAEAGEALMANRKAPSIR